MVSIKSSFTGLDLASERSKVIRPASNLPLTKVVSTLVKRVLYPRLVKGDALESEFRRAWPRHVSFFMQPVARGQS